MEQEVLHIAVYAEHASTGAGRIASIAEWPEDEDDHDYQWWHGTQEELGAEAREELARQDPRPGGAGMAYRHKAARAILEELGAE